METEIQTAIPSKVANTLLMTISSLYPMLLLYYIPALQIWHARVTRPFLLWGRGSCARLGPAKESV